MENLLEQYSNGFYTQLENACEEDDSERRSKEKVKGVGEGQRGQEKVKGVRPQI